MSTVPKFSWDKYDQHIWEVIFRDLGLDRHTSIHEEVALLEVIQLNSLMSAVVKRQRKTQRKQNGLTEATLLFYQL